MAFSKAIATGLGCAVLMTAAGCTTISDKNRYGPLLGETDLEHMAVAERGAPTYLRVRDTDSLETNSVRFRGAPIYMVIEAALGEDTQIVPVDRDVNLSKPVNIEAASMRRDEFLELLGVVTGYAYTPVNGTIEVSAWVSRTWSLQAFAASYESESKISGATGQRAGDGGGFGQGGQGAGGNEQGAGQEDRGIKASFTTSLDEWAGLVDTVKRIVGVSDAGAPLVVNDSAGNERVIAPGTPASRAQVTAIRSQGMIRAYGRVEDIRQADEWLTSVAKNSLKQVRLDARLIEVTLTESKARGINWDALIERTFESGLSSVGTSLNADFSPAPIPGAGSLGIGVGLDRANGDQINALLTLLGQYGEVELIDEPQAQTLNGRTSYIGSGEEFGFVASVEQTAVQGVIALSPRLQRILIGVELAVTPRVLEDDRVLMEVVPVVSTFQGFDNFEVDGSTFSQPRLTLKQLATTVVGRSGEPQFLGGLITSRVESQIRGLPLSERKLLGLEKLVESSSNNVERTELLLVITPTLVD